MNKIGIILVGMLIVGTATTLKAQESNDKIRWQLRGGVGHASALSVPHTDGCLGYHIGGAMDIALSKNGVWRIQPGLQFQQKGWTFEGYYGSEQIMPATFSTRLHYLELPVFAAARLRLGHGNYLTFKAGPYIAYGLSGKTTLSIHDTDYKESFSTNHFSEPCEFLGIAYDNEQHEVVYPKFNRWDVGIAEGIDLTLGHFILGASLSTGITHVSDKIFMGNALEQFASVLLFGGSPKNFTAEFSVGYQF